MDYKSGVTGNIIPRAVFGVKEGTDEMTKHAKIKS
jgi:hypothetical protein